MEIEARDYGCGSYLPASVCPVGIEDGPDCRDVPVGAFCEYDPGQGCSGDYNNDLDNCGGFDWYFKISANPVPPGGN